MYYSTSCPDPSVSLPARVVLASAAAPALVPPTTTTRKCASQIAAAAGPAKHGDELHLIAPSKEDPICAGKKLSQPWLAGVLPRGDNRNLGVAAAGRQKVTAPLASGRR